MRTGASTMRFQAANRTHRSVLGEDIGTGDGREIPQWLGLCPPSERSKEVTMKNALRFFAIALISMTLAACETTSTRPYTPSTQNIIAAQQLFNGSEAKVQLGSFRLAEGVNPNLTCRAMGALDVAPGKTPVEYIRSALQDELFAASALGPNGTEIDARITKLTFNSFGTGSWNVGLELSSPALPSGFTVEEKYEFKTSFSAISACQNTVDAFQPTVAALIASTLAHPDFGRLAGL